MAGIERVALVATGAAGKGVDVGASRYVAKGMRLSSSTVVLINTGELMSSSCDFDPLRDRDLGTSLSFKPLKSANSGVEGIRGDADALRACRTTFGDKKASGGGYVADLGAHGDGNGSGDEA
jgi:hypothetical protein